MAKIFGLVLMLLAIWYAVSVFNGESPFGGDAPAAAGPRAGATQALETPPPGGAAAPTAVTSRVRARMNAAVEERYRQQAGD